MTKTLQFRFWYDYFEITIVDGSITRITRFSDGREKDITFSELPEHIQDQVANYDK